MVVNPGWLLKSLEVLYKILMLDPHRKIKSEHGISINLMLGGFK